MKHTTSELKAQLKKAGATIETRGDILVGSFNNGAFVRANVEGDSFFLLTVGGRSDGGNGSAGSISAAIRRAKTGRELPLAQL